MVFFTLIVLIQAWSSPQNKEADQILGKWMSPKKDFIVECYTAENGSYNGKLLWFKKTKGKVRYDCEIAEIEWIGRDIMWAFQYKDSEWSRGKIKDLKKCNTYDAFITINDKNELTATGFVAFRWLGESMTFTKYKGDLPK
jgi:uncharacterized protein (DUF2147 family)